jgi:geranylgeranyl diphosphate synthase type I
MSTAQQALQLLKKYQKEVDFLLQEYFKKEIVIAKQKDIVAVDAIKAIRKFTLAGGKRLRPALLYYAYLAAGGTKKKVVKQASLSIELIHAFLLIHDDIMDNDDKRHGVDTVHKKYQKVARRYFPGKDSKHFGQSIGIVVGDLCYSMANKILFKANFKPEIILSALTRLQDIVYEVIPGQIRDIKLGYKGSATEKEILKVQEAKTAYYTFNAPIELGYILAGNKDSKDLVNFKKYSLAMGKAFQIRDDILGIFGNEKTLGKPIGSDIIEGKQTLLVNYVLRHGSSREKKKIKKLLGKIILTQQDLKDFREIIEKSGALKYSQEKGVKMIKEALNSLQKIDWHNQKTKIFFQGIAEYIIQRKV